MRHVNEKWVVILGILGTFSQNRAGRRLLSTMIEIFRDRNTGHFLGILGNGDRNTGHQKVPGGLTDELCPNVPNNDRCSYLSIAQMPKKWPVFLSIKISIIVDNNRRPTRFCEKVPKMPKMTTHFSFTCLILFSKTLFIIL